MKTNPLTYAELSRPIHVLEETRLRENLNLIVHVAKEADVEIILAFKVYALWRTFPIFHEYIKATIASPLFEARLGFEEFGAPTHTFSPGYTGYEIDDIARYSSHPVFNSLIQYECFHVRAKIESEKLSFGLRVNPEYSEVETLTYNPCAPGTRFGTSSDELPETLPGDIDNFHTHYHCESGSDVSERTLVHIEEKFTKWFSQLKWTNFGGNHLMTRKGYDVKRLMYVLRGFRKRYPRLKVILKPGGAFAWQTGPLVAQVIGIVEDYGIRTAILNANSTCHMPDCLEMPYHPTTRNIKLVDEDGTAKGEYTYRLGTNSCLSDDWMGSWDFGHALEVGENIIFEDMLRYTTTKTNMFNGISHPAIALPHIDNELEILCEYTYEDYRDRMD